MSESRPLVVGLSSAALYPHVMTEDAPAVAADLGFGVIELYLQTVGEYHPLFLAELQQRTYDLGLTVHALHIDTRHYHFWSDYRRRRDEAAALFAEAVHMAASLGALCIDWHGLTQAEVKAGVTIEAFLDTAAALGECAAADGVVLSLENVSWCWMRGPAEVMRLRQAGTPVGFTFDPFQAAEAQADPLAIVAAMGDGLTNVHVSDYAPGHRHLPVSEGDLDWHALLSALRATGYGGPLMLEAPQTSGESFVRQRHYLEGIRA
ncbi:MAG: sugar phosphate isomerase/epimerase [Anaerolineae bacterium]|nr:sugar phosphate isomerase/epimerase [Anaerolineae bacterium]